MKKSEKIEHFINIKRYCCIYSYIIYINEFILYLRIVAQMLELNLKFWKILDWISFIKTLKVSS